MQSNDLQVQIEYTDTTGARHTLQKSVPIQFRSSDATTSVQTGNGTYRQGQNSSTLIYQIVIVISVAIIAVVCYKKRKFLRNKLGRHSGKK